MLGHAPVAGLLESGGRSTCVQQSSRGVYVYVHYVGQVYITHLQQYDYFILYKRTGSIGGNVNKHNNKNNIKLEQHTFITITS